MNIIKTIKEKNNFLKYFIPKKNLMNNYLWNKIILMKINNQRNYNKNYNIHFNKNSNFLKEIII